MDTKSTILKFILKENIKKKWFTVEDLYKLFLEKNTSISTRSINKYLYQLKNNNEIYEFLNGVYTFEVKNRFLPQESELFSKVVKKIITKFPSLEIVFWETNWLNKFLNMVSFKNYLFVEAEKYVITSLFEFLKFEFPNKVYLEPDKNIIVHYANNLNESIIIKKLISKSPVKKVNTIYQPRLEKILVDIYNEDDIFYYYRGNELTDIFINVFNNYNINFSTMFNYAKRRGKIVEFINYTNKIFDKIEFNNDYRDLIFKRVDN